MTLSGTGELDSDHSYQLRSLLSQTESVIISEGITEIGSGVFYNCSTIQRLSIPNSVSFIGYHAFNGTAITSLHVPAKVADISYLTFAGCDQLEDITFGEGSSYTVQGKSILDQSGKTLIYAYQRGSYSVPTGVETIADQALRNPSITSVTIPKSVTSIGSYAAFYNQSLTTVTFEDPSTTVHFGEFVFSSCTSLTSINLPNPTAEQFWSYTDTPETIAELGYHMFEGCTSLKTISIPSSVKTFYNAPFAGSGLANVTIPNGTTTIAAGAFREMPNLTSVSLPTSVTSIERTAFGDCNQLSDVYYCGDQNGWNQVSIDPSNVLGDDYEDLSFGTNKALINATVHYGHRWSDWTVTTSPTLEAEGEQVRTCTTCGTTDTEVLSKLPCPFTDVANPKSYYYDAVLWAVDNGVTTGTTATTFSPDSPCNRGQIVVFLWRLAGQPTAANRNNPFTDVKESDYCYEAVLWAVENGITNGATSTTFAPRRTCNRGEIVTFLWRYAGKPKAQNQKNQFTDVKNGSFCYDAVLWAVENKITLGKTKTHFEPKSTCVRGQAVTFLYRAKDLFHS